MGLQCAAVFAIFVALRGPYPSASANAFFAFARAALIWAMLAATILSGLQYLWRAVVLLRGEGPKVP